MIFAPQHTTPPLPDLSVASAEPRWPQHEPQTLARPPAIGDVSPWGREHDRYTLACTEVAALAYCRSEETVHLNARAVGYDRGILVDAGGAECIVLFSREVIVVGVRGTSEPGDVWTDAKMLWRRRWSDLPSGTIACGVVDQAEALRHRVLSAIGAVWRYDRPPIVITAHSLGAAVAPALALILKAAGYPVRQVVQLESPRPFGRKGARAYNAAGIPTWNVRNARRGVVDAISRLPRRWMGGWSGGLPVTLADAETYVGQSAWREARGSHRIPWHHVRLVSRTILGIRAHLMTSLQAVLWSRLGRR